MANKDFKVKNGIDVATPIPVSMGGTGQTSTTNTLNSLLPAQTGNANKVLQTDGTNTTWVTLPNGYQKGNTASRPGSPSIGDIYSNTETGYIEVYISAGWSQLGVIPITPSTPTATDVGTNVAYGSGSVDVTFTPSVQGGLVSTFTAVSSPSGITGSGSSSPVRVSSLVQGTPYTFAVTATNGYGNAIATSPSNSVTPTSVPQSPTIGTATATGASGTVSVTFSAGATGGKTITGFTVTSSPGGLTASGASSPLVVTGLTNGTAYTFTATATNANGTSAASEASNSVTPFIFSATGGQETQTIGSYKYHIFTASGNLVVSGSKNMEILAIGAGGGGGGSGSAGPGGGGAGAISPASGYSTVSVSTGNQAVTIGAGGGGGAPGQNGSNGGASSLLGVSSPGGGSGSGGEAGYRNGGSGGSGGGASLNGSPGGASGTNTNVGGGSNFDEPRGGGGGGGSNGAGGFGGGNGGGGGGAGRSISSIDANLTAGNFPTTLTGKTNICFGGNGATNNTSSTIAPATPSGYGSGGSGSGRDYNVNIGQWNAYAGASGAPGLVIVRYLI